MAVLETDWGALQAAFVTWVETVTGRNASWRDDHQFVADPNPHFYLHLQNLSERHIPYVVHEYDAVNDVVVPKQVRHLTVLLEVSCIANDQFPGGLAQQELARLRAKTYLPGMRDALEAQRISLMDSRDVASIPFEHQGRFLSQATAEFVFSFQDVYQDTDLAEDYIESVVDVLISDPDLVDVWPRQPTNALFTTDWNVLLTADNIILEAVD